MIYKEVTVGASVNALTLERWFKVSLKAELEEGENIDEVFAAVKSKVNAFANNQPTIPENTTISTDEDIIAAIQKASMQEIKTYFLIAKKNPKISAAITNRIKELNK